jgi:hypothetical protein
MISLPKYKGFEQERIIGEYSVALPDPPNLKLIANYHQVQENQLWRRPDTPKNYLVLPKKDQLEIANREWDRRLNGYWFFNNGNIEYMTGTNYFYCGHWKLDGIYPMFIDSDRDFFYLWAKAEADKNSTGLIYIADRREGKALSIDTDIPTPDGWVKMGDIRVGDVVFGSNGQTTNVIWDSSVMYNHNTYKVEFSDGSFVIADEDHLWIANSKNDRVKIKRGQSIPTQIVTTKHILETVKTSTKSESNWSIRNAMPVQHSEKLFSIPPYILGAWLGDGTSTGSIITSVDSEIIDAWESYGESVGLPMVQDASDNIMYRLARPKWSSNKINPMRKALKDLGIFGSGMKRIPVEYLHGSFEQRLDLLKGLMDTDGCVSGSYGKGVEFCSKSIGLATDVKELITSLGYKVRLTSKFNKKYGKTYYYLRFSHNGLIPFALKRKRHACNLGDLSGGWDGQLRYIIAVTPVESVPVKCIKVDNADSSFLCTRDFIVTHNTYKATCILYDGTSTVEDRIGTIQSKTDKDAGIVFAKMINSWRNLPPYFSPTHEGISLPKSALRFFEPSKKDTKSKRMVYEPALNSYIDFLPANEVAADGIKVVRYVGDEIGKTVRINVADRNKVVRECLMDGATIVGKEILTTTVEEMESGGGKYCKEIWDSSDPLKLDPLGRTKTGLMRYFKPADYGLKGVHPVTGLSFVDRYGNSNRPMMRQFLEDKRSALEGEDLKSEKRKYPLTIEEAFQSTNQSCVFNTEILYQRREELLAKNPTRRINFYRDAETGMVKWNDAPENGRWLISWDFENEAKSNRHIMKKGMKFPANSHSFSIGCDPFGHTVITGKGSMAAAYVYREFDDLDPDNSGKPICQYHARQPLVAMMNDDFMLMGEYYGCKVLIESNFDAFVEFFMEADMMGYLMQRPKNTRAPGAKVPKVKEWGLPSKNGYGLTRHLKVMVEYVENYGDKIDFVDLIEDMLDYDPMNRTIYDLSVSFGISLLASEAELIPKHQNPEEEKQLKFLKTFSIRSGLY